KAALIERYPEAAAALARESSPLTKLLEENAYRELVWRQRVNEAAQAVMLAYACGADLDNLAALLDVARNVIEPADPEARPPRPAILESDHDFRARILLSLEGLSVAGPPGAYRYHALSADGQVADASVSAPTFSDPQHSGERVSWQIDDAAGLDDPRPGDVVIAVLARSGDGSPDQALLDTVHDALYEDYVRPLTDRPIVRAAAIVDYQVKATIYIEAGPDRALVMADAQEAITRHVKAGHRLGLDMPLSGIYAALHQPGVHRVELTEPAADISVNARQAPYCTDIELTYGGRDE